MNELRAASSTILDKSLENTAVKYNDCESARKCARTFDQCVRAEMTDLRSGEERDLRNIRLAVDGSKHSLPTAATIAEFAAQWRAVEPVLTAQTKPLAFAASS